MHRKQRLPSWIKSVTPTVGKMSASLWRTFTELQVNEAFISGTLRDAAADVMSLRGDGTGAPADADRGSLAFQAEASRLR